MVEATIEDLAITIRSLRETIWDHPHIVCEDVLSTTKIFTGAKPFLKANIKHFGITEIEMPTLKNRSFISKDESDIICCSISSKQMPLYEYKCTKCGSVFEILQKVNDPLLKKCIHCQGSVKKVLSPPALQFKGSGWYVTDYAPKGKRASDSEPKKKPKKDKDTSPKKKDSSSSSEKK